MFSKGRKKGTIRFVVTPKDGSRKVQVAGDFNDWVPTAMRKQKDGSYVAVIAAEPGTYEYKFVVDDTWIVDPDNSAWALNPYGTVNSVAQLE